jgi:adenosylcobinamide-phosphate synthase
MLGLLLERTLPWPLQALALKPAFAGRALLSAAERVEHDLCVGDLSHARTALKSLVSRPTVQLDDTLVAAAAIESLAENLVDSYVAPLAMYAAFGLGGAYAYRAANTADAMWGYRTPEYEWLGKAAARLDDALNWFPARLGAVLLVLVGPQRRRAWRIWRRDAPLTTSPYAGQPMAACAGQLGVRLEKLEHYVLYAEGRPPAGGDIAAARGVVARAMFWTAVAVLLVRGVTRAAPRRGGRPQ